MSSNENQLKEKPQIYPANEDVKEDADFGMNDAGFENDDTDLDWDARTLCGDGNCIGVIGPDGLCKECGKRYEGTDAVFEEQKTDEPELTYPEEGEVFESEDSVDGEDDDDDGDELQSSSEKDDLDLDWESRKLCSDGSCIGVIGPDGLCKECGKPYEGDV